MASKIQMRRDTATNWTNQNSTLSSGEFGVVTDTGKMKIGDGVSNWGALGYYSGDSGGAFVTDASYNTTLTNNTVAWNASANNNVVLTVGYGSYLDGANSYYSTYIGHTPPKWTAAAVTNDETNFSNIVLSTNWSTTMDGQSSGGINYNVVVGDAYFHTAAGGSESIRYTNTLGYGNFSVTSGNLGIAGANLVGKGSFDMTTGSTFNMQYASIIGGFADAPKQKITNSKRSLILGSENAYIDGNSDGVVMIGVQDFTVTGASNATAPVTYMGKIAIGRGTNGALPALSTGYSAIGICDTTGELGTFTAAGGAFAEDANYNVYRDSVETPYIGGASDHNISMALTEQGGYGPVTPMHCFTNSSDNIVIGNSAFLDANCIQSIYDNTLVNTFTRMYSEHNCGDFKQNVALGGSLCLDSYAGPTGGTANFDANVVLDSWISGYWSEIAGNRPNTGNSFMNSSICLDDSTVTRSSVIASRNLCFTGAANYSTWLNVNYATQTDLGTTSDNTVHMPKVKIGRGDNAALPALAGGYSAIGICDTTGELGTFTIGGSPGGTDTQVQFNDAGTFGGSLDFTFDSTNNTLSHTYLNPGDINYGSSSRTAILASHLSTYANNGFYGYVNFNAARRTFVAASYLGAYDGTTNINGNGNSLISSHVFETTFTDVNSHNNSAISAHNPIFSNALCNAILASNAAHIQNVDNSVIIGGKNITLAVADTVAMPKVRMGLGTGGALPALASGYSSLGIDDTTGELGTFTAAAAGGGAFAEDASSNLYRDSVTTPTFTNSTDNMTMFVKDQLSSFVNTDCNIVIGGQNVYITGFATAPFSAYCNTIIGARDACIEASADKAYSYDNIMLGGNGHTIKSSGYYHIMNDNMMVGGNNNAICHVDNTAQHVYTWRNMFSNSDNVKMISQTDNQDMIQNSFINSCNMNVEPTVDLCFGVAIGLRYTVATSVDLASNTVHMPKVKIGRGNFGALPTSGGTNFLHINTATGEIIIGGAV